MSTQSGSYIRFDQRPQNPKKKTQEWVVVNKDNPGAPIGEVYWYNAWRCYCFFPARMTLFEKKCLRDIANFCEVETDKRKGR